MTAIQAIDIQAAIGSKPEEQQFDISTLTIGKEEDLALCVTCGTQYDVPLSEAPRGCRICEDPRQYVPPEGQLWTSLAKENGKHENTFEQDKEDERFWYINTTPKLGIGERAIFIQTPDGNVLWDLIAWIDHKTVDWIKSKGGLKAIVISHPHFYTTHLIWARIFNCPIYTHSSDKTWFNREDHDGYRKPIAGATQTIVPGIEAIHTGGHFPGSMVLHFDNCLFVADTFTTVPSAHTPAKHREPNTNTYVFLYSIPNMIALSPPEIWTMWRALEPFKFSRSLGSFTGQNVMDPKLKRRVLESMQNQVRLGGWTEEAAEILGVPLKDSE